MLNPNLVALLGIAAQQGPVALLAIVMFFMWVRTTREHITRLENLIRERKADRDAMLQLLGKLDGQLGLIAALRREP